MNFDHIIVSELVQNRLINEYINWKTQQSSPIALNNFYFPRKAKELIDPARIRGQHHRKREEHYTKMLEVAEKKLKEEGISMEIIDPRTGAAQRVESGHFASGAISSLSNISPGGWTQPTNVPKFQPKINQEMLGDVEKFKLKMLEHRDKAERFEKFHRAFTCCPPDTMVNLTVEDVHFFQLES